MGRRFGFGYWGIAGSLCFDEGGGAGAGAGAGDGGAGGGGGAPEKVSMTQAELEALISGRVAAAVKQVEKKSGGGTSDEERKELDALRKEREARDLKDKEARGQYDAALKSQEESIRKEYEPKLTEAQESAKKLRERLLEKTIGVEVVNAAAKFNAVNPERVKRLLSHPGEPIGYIKPGEDDEPIVVDAQNNQRFVNGKPMTPEQLVKEYLDGNPNEVKSNAGDGGGAGDGKSKGGDASPIAELEAEITDLEKKYQTTRDIRLLTTIGQKNAKLRELKAKK
jgi:hypothetical protein